jgi:hypothetical protein
MIPSTLPLESLCPCCLERLPLAGKPVCLACIITYGPWIIRHYRQRHLPPVPTAALPGPEKVAVLAERFRAGLELFHPADAVVHEDRPAVPVLLDDGTPRLCFKRRRKRHPHVRRVCTQESAHATHHRCA